MGLALATRIFEQHNGQIWVETSIQNGATFYFSMG
ncbi:MAG: hypothetical protein H6636_11445 [Anaerolineales bacterium]|nr:hypothetical protein [Anaerolineales bacterium]